MNSMAIFVYFINIVRLYIKVDRLINSKINTRESTCNQKEKY
jgi:hypothetical protein